MQDERRNFQRLHLTRPADGSFGDVSVRVLDVSATGALVESTTPLPAGTTGRLRFLWRGREVDIDAQVIRTVDTEVGLRLTGDTETLRSLISESAAEVLRAQQANMEGNREANVVGDETLTAASAGLRARGYVTWTLEEKGWKKRHTLLPEQPENGFTVAAGESPEQIEMLRQTWENGNEESRRMTRLLAELSSSSVREK